eukprot:GHVU01141083.1.p1 GENE.GHVU01141083.1~~GHVU01141083.1.p1  ORF type:complete len:169 (-),score=15.05 GHVU01141083.1:16-522(-)
MWLHGGRFLNGVCLFIRCYHNTADPAFAITMLSEKLPSQEQPVEVKKKFRPDEDLTDKNCASWVAKVKDEAKTALERRKEGTLQQSYVDNLVVYMRDSHGYWYSLDNFNRELYIKESGYGHRPTLYQADTTRDHPEFLLTDSSGTWPGLCVWVRSRLWVVSRDLVGSV